eukprot:8445325-Alexandrium_andersonii.AAC.1
MILGNTDRAGSSTGHPRGCPCLYTLSSPTMDRWELEPWPQALARPLPGHSGTSRARCASVAEWRFQNHEAR